MGTLQLKKPVDISSKVQQVFGASLTTNIGQYTNRCYVLIGLPCTGKSTWADTILKSWKNAAYPVIVCEDDVISDEMERTGESYTDVITRYNPEDLKRDVRNRVVAALGVRRDIIIDGLNLTVDDRAEYLSLLPDSYQKIGVVFTLPMAMMQQRLERRHVETGRPHSKLVIQNMMKRYEKPVRDEFFRVTDIDHLCRYQGDTL